MLSIFISLIFCVDVEEVFDGCAKDGLQSYRASHLPKDLKGLLAGSGE